MDKRIVRSDPWPALPIHLYTDIKSGPWGRLIQYDDNTFYFSSDEIPKHDEIIKYWGHRLKI